MNIRIQCLCIDTTNPARLAGFWQQALGWRRTFEEDDQIVLEPPEGKNRLHLDLRPQDQTAEVARLEALGAERADVGQGPDVTWVVMKDPDGNYFDVLAQFTPEQRATLGLGGVAGL